MKKILIAICLLTAATAQAQTNRRAFHSANKNASVERRIYLNFSKTNLSLGTKWNNVFGTPNLAVVTVANLTDTTGAATGIGFTTIATGNWLAYSSNTSTDDYNASVTGTWYPASNTIPSFYRSNWWNYGTAQPGRYQSTKPQMRLTGLNPAKLYTIYISTAELPPGQGFDDKGVFRVVGLTSPAAVEIDGDVASQNAGATFALQPKVGGTIDIFCNTSAAASGNLVTIPALIIVESDL